MLLNVLGLPPLGQADVEPGGVQRPVAQELLYRHQIGAMAIWWVAKVCLKVWTPAPLMPAAFRYLPTMYWIWRVDSDRCRAETNKPLVAIAGR